MSFTNLFLLFLSFVFSVNALATPHAHRAIHHRAIAGRVASPAPVHLPVIPVRRRQNGKRCKPRPSSATSSRTLETTNHPSHTLSHTPTHVPLIIDTSVTIHTPTTSKKENPPPATTKQPSPPPSSNSPSYMVGTQIGQGTFYATGLGACGITNKDSDHIAAVSHLLFDTFPGYDGVNPNKNPLCGRQVTATYQGKQVTVTITDRCTGCQTTDLDFSPSAFNVLADFSIGRLDNVHWVWD